MVLPGMQQTVVLVLQCLSPPPARSSILKCVEMLCIKVFHQRFGTCSGGLQIVIGPLADACGQDMPCAWKPELVPVE